MLDVNIHQIGLAHEAIKSIH